MTRCPLCGITDGHMDGCFKNGSKVVPIRNEQMDPTAAEKFSAYFVVLAVLPATSAATAAERLTLVNRVIAGQRLAKECLIAQTDDARTRCDTVLELMASDEKVLA